MPSSETPRCAARGEVGALAYFCECSIVDRFTVRARIAEHIEEAREQSWFYRLNYLMLDTDELDPIEPDYWLDWRSGSDRTGRGWDTTGIDGTRRKPGHYELLTRRPPPHTRPGNRHSPDLAGR